MDRFEALLLAAGAAVIIVAIVIVVVFPALGGGPTDSVDTGSGGPTDGD